MTKMHPFTNSDWDCWGGAEQLPCGATPRIGSNSLYVVIVAGGIEKGDYLIELHATYAEDCAYFLPLTGGMSTEDVVALADRILNETNALFPVEAEAKLHGWGILPR